MGFWIFMLITDLLVPLIMLIFGRYFTKKAPNEINYLFGYRTPRSMKNEKTWQFAHQTIGKIWWRAGWLFLLPIIALFFMIKASVDVVGTVGAAICLAQTVALIFTILPVERALKRRFDDDGNERE